MALYLGFAREMVKIRFLVPNVSAGNITSRHKQHFVCELHVQQVWYTRNLRWRRNLCTKQHYAKCSLSLTAATHDSSYRQRCYTDHKQINKSGLLGRDAVATDVSKAGSFLFICLTLKMKAIYSSETRKPLTQRYVTSQKTSVLSNIALRTTNLANIHSFCCLPHRSITSSKASFPQSAT